MINKDGGGGQFLDFCGGHRAHESPPVPPLGKTLDADVYVNIGMQSNYLTQVKFEKPPDSSYANLSYMLQAYTRLLLKRYQAENLNPVSDLLSGYTDSHFIGFVNKSCCVLFFTSALAKNCMSHADKHAGHTTPLRG